MNKRLLGFKNKNNYLRHLTELFSLHCSQFVYTGLPDTIPAEWLELFLAINGTVGIGEVKELENRELYTAIGSYNGNYNGYLPDSYTAAVLGIGEISGKWYGKDKTIIVGKNNLLGQPEYDIPFTAEVLTQIDISESVNVIFSRLSRIPIVDNDTQKQAIESAIKSIVKGDIFAVANKTIKSKFDEFLEGAKEAAENNKFLDLVDVDKINGLQYLNQYRDNVLKRYLARRGYMIQTTSKLAQQTNAEIHGSDSYALLYPQEQLKCRQDICKAIGELKGLEVSVDFNPILKKVFNDYFAPPEVSKPEETGEESGEQTEETNTEEVEDNDDTQSSNS